MRLYSTRAWRAGWALTTGSGHSWQCPQLITVFSSGLIVGLRAACAASGQGDGWRGSSAGAIRTGVARIWKQQDADPQIKWSQSPDYLLSSIFESAMTTYRGKIGASSRRKSHSQTEVHLVAIRPEDQFS